MNPKIKLLIRDLHLLFDGLISRIFTHTGTLEQISDSPHLPLEPSEFLNFRYSKFDHFHYFKTLPKYNRLSPSICDLKVYQDELVYTFILDNLPYGKRILEIGGGESRIINQLKDHYEIWNLDKLHGSGFGPKQLINTDGFRIIRDYIGNFSTLLPDNYFDLVFSISTIEHLPNEKRIIKNSINDITRLLKPGAYSLHCIDALLFDDHYTVHPFVPYVHESGLVVDKMLNFEELKENDDVWSIPAYAYYTRWYHLVRRTMRDFGHPFSINLLWQA